MFIKSIYYKFSHTFPYSKEFDFSNFFNLISYPSPYYAFSLPSSSLCVSISTPSHFHRLHCSILLALNLLRCSSNLFSFDQRCSSCMVNRGTLGPLSVCMTSLRHKALLLMNIYCLGRNLTTASSSSLLPVKLPAQREVHFWYVLPDEVKSTNLLNRYLEILSPCEKESILTMREEQIKKRALLARALVRTTLARYHTNCQIDPKSLKFRKNNYGKPELDLQYADDWSLPPLHFNISHTSSLIACGVTVGSAIGIDVEEKQRRLKNDTLAFAQRFFSPCEIEMLTHIVDPELRLQEFIKLWTLKEAYVKALGKGFSASPFKTFTVRLGDHVKGNIHAPPHMISKAHDITVESSDDLQNPSSNWQFGLLELAGSHYAAVCIEQDSIDAGNGSIPIDLTLRKTIPYVEDECISATDSAVVIGGLTRLSVCD